MSIIEKHLKVIGGYGTDFELGYITAFSIFNKGTSKVVFGFHGLTKSVLEPNQFVTFEAGANSMFSTSSTLRVDFESKGNENSLCLIQYDKLNENAISIIRVKELSRAILHLNLKAKWFDMIEQQIKLQEYRDYTDYWHRVFKRVLNDNNQMDDKIKIKGKYYNPTDVIICFSNGYAKKRRQMYVEIKEFGRGLGREEWGAIPKKWYYILTLGNILIKLNCNTNKSNN